MKDTKPALPFFMSFRLFMADVFRHGWDEDRRNSRERRPRFARRGSPSGRRRPRRPSDRNRPVGSAVSRRRRPFESISYPGRMEMMSRRSPLACMGFPALKSASHHHSNGDLLLQRLAPGARGAEPGPGEEVHRDRFRAPSLASGAGRPAKPAPGIRLALAFIPILFRVFRVFRSSGRSSSNAR